MKKIFDFIKKHKSLDIVRYNKKFQKLLEFNINDYIENFRLYSSIIIELKIDDKIKKEKDKFINILYEEKDYYHIYFDNSNEEIKRNYFKEKEKVNKIKILINYQVKSFENPENIPYIFVTLLVLKLIRFNFSIDEHPESI